MEFVNSTATFKVKGPVDLLSLLGRQELWPKRTRGFASVSVLLFLNNRNAATALVYATGSVVLVGARSMNDLEEAVQVFLHVTDTTLVQPLKLHNIAYSFRIPPQPLEALYCAVKSSGCFDDVSLEPEMFPALTFRLKGTNRKACVFASGKVNLVGNKSEPEALQLRDMFLAVCL